MKESALDQNQSKIESVQDALLICRRSFLAVAVFSFFINVLMLTPMFYMINVYDKAVATGSIPTLVSLVVVAAFLYLVMGVLEWVRSKVLVHVGTRLDILLAPRIYDLCFDSQSGQAGSAPTGSQPLSELNALRQFMSGPSAAVVFDLPWTPVFVLLMFFFHPLLALVAIICIGIMATIALANQRATTAALQDANQKASHITQQNQRNLRNAEVVAAMGMMKAFTTKWRKQQDSMLDVQESASSTASGYSAVIKTLSLAMQSAAITTGAVLAMAQEITPGVIIGAALLLGKTLQPIQQAVSGWKGFVDARDQYRRLNDLLQRFPPRQEKMDLPDILGKIAITDAEVAPPGSTEPILKGVSLEIDPGKTVMVVGSSGAGKSTLVRAILGLWPTLSGSVRIDGAEAHYYDREKIGRQIGYLPQGIELFDGSVAENIARFSSLESDAVILAAKDAGVHEFILSLPEGYDSVLGAGGVGLSPGQQQRLALARALYKRPKLLIMDEPNSNLDQAGEKALNHAISLMKTTGSTIVLVSHRQTVVPLVDEIVVIKDGKIAEQVSKDEVVRRATAAAQQNAKQASLEVADGPQRAGPKAGGQEPRGD